MVKEGPMYRVLVQPFPSPSWDSRPDDGEGAMGCLWAGAQEEELGTLKDTHPRDILLTALRLSLYIVLCDCYPYTCAYKDTGRLLVIPSN